MRPTYVDTHGIGHFNRPAISEAVVQTGEKKRLQIQLHIPRNEYMDAKWFENVEQYFHQGVGTR